MRSCKLFWLLVFVYSSCPGQTIHEQTGSTIRYPDYAYLEKIIKGYFRSDPLQSKFSWFLDHLIHDPILVNKTIDKKTDSTLFFFQGEYRNYSPYSFLADRTEVGFAEKEFLMDDSLSAKDTLFVYQLLGYSNHGKPGLEAVKKEYSKFNHRFGRHFILHSSIIKNGTDVVGETENYFIPGFAISPLSASWVKFDELRNAFIITIRFKNE